MTQRRVDPSSLTVAPETPLLEAMGVIDRAGLRTALVAEGGGRVVGLLTDGDVRRFLLAGGSLQAPAGDAATGTFLSVGPDAEPHEVLRLLLDRGVTCVPALDGAGRLAGLHTFRTALESQESDSWAVVMVGGRGTRLGELTDAIPKPMLPVDGRPILEPIVEPLVSHGVRRVFLAVNYLATMIEDHFVDGRRFHCRIEYLREDEPLGTGGPLALLPERPTAPLVVMNGDLLTRIHIGRLLRFHAHGGFAATLALREHTVEVPFGVAELDGERVTGLVEKPTLRYDINAGIYVVEPSLLDRIPRGEPFPITELWRAALADGLPLGGYRMSERWHDIGRPAQYEAAAADLARAQREGAPEAAPGDTPRGPHGR